MSDEGFFRRWARLKASDKAAPPAAGQRIDLPPLAQREPHPALSPAPIVAGEPPQRPLPTLDDVALLGADSDFSAFVTHGVDKAVQRLAMKKLFSDPHFRLTDGLDVYIDDYTGADPVSAAMLASLEHARSALARAMEDDPAAPEPPLPGQDDRPGDEPPQSPQGKA